MVSSTGGAFRPRGARAIHHPTKEGGRMVRYTRIRNDTKQKKALISGRKNAKKMQISPTYSCIFEKFFVTLYSNSKNQQYEHHWSQSSMVQAVVTMDDLFAE